MTHESSGSRVLMAVTAGALMLSALLFAAPSAHACPKGQLEDSVTGMCWSQSGQGEAFSSGGGPCLPGRIGSCVGTLQKSSPHTTSPQNSAIPCGFGPESGYPCGYW